MPVVSDFDGSVADPTPALRLAGVGLRRGDRDVLADVDWTVGPHDRWVVLGANGSGKTSLVRIAALLDHPSTGTVDLLGERLGRTDVRVLRRRVGLTSAALAERFRPRLTAEDVVVTARHAALEPWWHDYDDADRAEARRLLDRSGVGDLAERAFGTLSSGERQRVLLARALWGEPGLVLLDEPTAGLDLGGREDLVAALADLAADPDAPATVLVTHHVEEVPPGFDRLLVLRAGRVVACGTLDELLTSEVLSEAFGRPLVVERHADGRFTARAG